MEDKVTKMTQPQVTATQKPALACFVAGTLVHTQTGLRRIEEIKVGDYVLSKPENGEGEPSYKRVSKTFEYDDKEVWFVYYEVINDDYSFLKGAETDFFVATGNHPVWVKAVKKNGAIEPLNQWTPVKHMAWQYMADAYLENVGGDPIFELADGRMAKMTCCRGLLADSANPNIAIWGGESHYILEQCGGAGVDFSDKLEGPRWVSEVYLNPVDMETYPYEEAPPDSVAARMGFGYPPYLAKVYNLEVEDNHTYYVNQLGVWVHNTYVDFN